MHHVLIMSDDLMWELLEEGYLDRPESPMPAWLRNAARRAPRSSRGTAAAAAAFFGLLSSRREPGGRGQAAIWVPEPNTFWIAKDDLLETID